MEAWSLSFNFNLDYEGKQPKHVTFIAKTDEDAKNKILNICQKIVSRRRKAKWDFFIMHAMPYLSLHDRKCDGERTLRIKDKFSNRRILGIKNPEKVLVQGYGNEALNKISEY